MTHDELIEKAARKLLSLGNHHHWFPQTELPKDDSIGRDEFLAIVELVFKEIGLTPDMVIVPREPTDAMIIAAIKHQGSAYGSYRAMIAAWERENEQRDLWVVR